MLVGAVLKGLLKMLNVGLGVVLSFLIFVNSK